MAVVCLQTPTSPSCRAFMAGVHEKLQGKSLLQNPFIGGVRCWISRDTQKKDYYAVSITPVYPPFYWIGPVYLVAVWFFTWPKLLTWWGAPGFLLMSLGFFWSRTFYYIMLLLGIFKNVKGVGLKVRPVTYKRMVLRIIKR